MNEWLPLFNAVFAFGSVLLLAASALLMVLWFRKSPYLGRISAHALPILFIVSLAASVTTLIYSEVFGVEPCALCWFQRAFLYPQTVMLGLALWLRDQAVFKYIIALSIAGALFALNHHLLQMTGGSLLPCPASGSVDCAKRIVFEFGFVTFPLMAFAVFAFSAAVAFIARSSNK